MRGPGTPKWSTKNGCSRTGVVHAPPFIIFSFADNDGTVTGKAVCTREASIILSYTLCSLRIMRLPTRTPPTPCRRDYQEDTLANVDEEQSGALGCASCHERKRWRWESRRMAGGEQERAIERERERGEGTLESFYVAALGKRNELTARTRDERTCDNCTSLTFTRHEHTGAVFFSFFFFYGHISKRSPPRQRLHDTHCTQQRRPYTPSSVMLSEWRRSTKRC